MKRRSKRTGRRRMRKRAGKCPFGVKPDGTPVVEQPVGDFIEIIPIPESIQRSVSEVMRRYGLSKLP